MEDTKSPLSIAGDRIRATAQWLTLSLAILGGVILAGTQLSSIGSLEPGSERFETAVRGGVATAIGALIILAAAAWTASTTPVRLAKLNEGDEKLNDPALLEGYSDLRKLKSEYVKAVQTRRTTFIANKNSPTSVTKTQAEAAQMNAIYLSGIVRNVLQVASYYKLANTWRIAAFATGVGAVVAATGLVFFVWAANPPDDAKASLAAPAIIGNLSEQTLQLLPAGQEVLSEKLGAQCPISKPLKVLFLSSTDAGPDVIVQQENCNPVRLILGSEWGAIEKSDPLP